MLTPMQTIAAIAVMALVTFLTRALPFLLFDRSTIPLSWYSIWAGCCPPRSSPCSLSTV